MHQRFACHKETKIAFALHSQQTSDFFTTAIVTTAATARTVSVLEIRYEDKAMVVLYTHLHLLNGVVYTHQCISTKTTKLIRLTRRIKLLSQESSRINVTVFRQSTKVRRAIRRKHKKRKERVQVLSRALSVKNLIKLINVIPHQTYWDAK